MTDQSDQWRLECESTDIATGSSQIAGGRGLANQISTEIFRSGWNCRTKGNKHDYKE